MVKTFKIFSYRTNSPMIMELGMEYYELKLYTVYIKDDPELTLTYFSSMSNFTKLVSSPEPKAHGELIVYRSIRRPSVSPSVNIFKLKYLRNRWANRNQILSEASLGWGIDCIRFWIR